MNTINEKIETLKAKIVELVAKNCLSNDKKYNKEILLYSAVLGWFEEEKDIDSLNEKSKAFLELSNMLELELLFKKIKNINKTNDKEEIINAIRIYKILINDEKYKELTEKSKYKLPKDFEEKENYLNSSLYEKVIFFESFKSLLIESLDDLKDNKKEGYKL